MRLLQNQSDSGVDMEMILRRTSIMQSDDRRSFVYRLGMLIAAMIVIIAADFLIGSRESKKSGVGLLYGAAIYAACLAAILLGPRMERYATTAIALVLIVAVAHSSYELWAELTSKEPYELPSLDVHSAVDFTLAGFGVAVLFAFRASRDSIMRSAWVMALLDLATTVEDVGATLLINRVGSQALSIGSEVFDIAATAVAAVVTARMALAMKSAPAA